MEQTGSIDFSSLFADPTSGKTVVAPQPSASAKPLRVAVDHAVDAEVEALYVRSCERVRGLRVPGSLTPERFVGVKATAEEILVFAEKGTQDLFDAVFAKDRAEDPLVAAGVNIAALVADISRSLYEERTTCLFLTTVALLRGVRAEDCRALGDAQADAIAEVIEQAYDRAVDAQLVGLCERYESLTHVRSGQDTLSSIGALKTIIGGETVSARIIKAFITRVGLYPKGTYAELNTKEIARVQQQHPQMPASPVVEVVLNAKGEKAAERRIIDLSRGTRIYIVRAV